MPVLALAAVAVTALSDGGGSGNGGTPGGAATTGTGDGDGSNAVGRVARTIQVDGRPNGVAAVRDRVWILRGRSDRLTVLDAETGRRVDGRPRAGDLPANLAVADGRLWVAVQRPPSVAVISERSGRRSGRAITMPVRGAVIAIAAEGRSGVWVGVRTNPGLIFRLDPDTRKIVKRIEVPDGVQDIAVGAGAVWVVGRTADTVTRVDLSNGRQSIINVGAEPAGVAVGEGGVWVTNSGDDSLTRIDLGSLVTRVIGVGDAPYRVATGGGAVWVANRNDSTLSRIDPETNRVVGDPVEVRSNPFAIDVRGHVVWVTSPPDGTVQRVDF